MGSSKGHGHESGLGKDQIKDLGVGLVQMRYLVKDMDTGQVPVRV